VTAPDAEAAIRKAIEQYGITEVRTSRGAWQRGGSTGTEAQ
jgi:hypothetical protein